MTSVAPGPRKFYRSTTDRKIAGVCGGLARYLNIDPTLVRVLWVVLTLVSGGAGLLAYILLWALAPEDNALLPPVPGFQAVPAVAPAATAKPARPSTAKPPKAKGQAKAAAKPKSKPKSKPKAKA